MSLPKDHPIILAHKHSIRNLPLLEVAHRAHCFYCLKSFSPSEITKWVDRGRTALCPHCGIDSVLPASMVPSPDFLREMEDYWFGELKGS